MTIIDNDIRILRAEAAAAGDTVMVDICKRALKGDVAARVECWRVINAARAMAD